MNMFLIIIALAVVIPTHAASMEKQTSAVVKFTCMLCKQEEAKKYLENRYYCCHLFHLSCLIEHWYDLLDDLRIIGARQCPVCKTEERK